MNTDKGRRKFPVEMVILFLAAGFAAYNFSLAGGYIEGTHFSAGGLIAGVVVNVSLAIAASRFGSINGKKRTKQAMASFIIMLILSPALVGPVVFYSLPETFLGHWIARAIWSAAWPLVADLAIVLAGAVMGKGLIALSEPSATQSDAGATESANGATHKVRGATERAKSATQSGGLYPKKCDHCNALLNSPNAVGGHMKKYHPEKCKQKTVTFVVAEEAKR
jgi:hypothetical protein